MGRERAPKSNTPSGGLNEAGKDLLAMYSGQSFDSEERKRVGYVVRAKAIVKSNILQSREDSNKFIEYCFTDGETGKPVKQQDFHREIQDAVMDPNRKDEVHMLPRDHGKTTQLEGGAIWMLGNNPNLRIKIVSESDNRAVERLFSIIQHIRTNPKVHAVFPHLKPAKLGDWTKHKIVVERDRIMRDASIEALGILSTATGGRADVLLADDAVGRRNSIEQPKLRETVKSAWNSDWSNLLEPGGKTLWICTPWHVADATHMLMKNPTYNVVRCPVGTDGDPCSPIWEEKWPREELERRRRKIGELEYNRGFRLIALSGEFATVSSEWIAYWDYVPDVDSLQIFVAFDVSSGTSKDFFACVVLGVDPKTLRIYVLEAWHAKLTFLGRAEAVTRTIQRWQPNMTGIEQDTMKSLTQYLDETTLLNIVALRPTLSKAVRLIGITPPMERGQVLFNPALQPDRIGNREEHGDVVGELTEFPLAANDDMVDAYVHAMNLAMTYGGADDADGVEIMASVIGGNSVPTGLFDVEDRNGNGFGAV